MCFFLSITYFSDERSRSQRCVKPPSHSLFCIEFIRTFILLWVRKKQTNIVCLSPFLCSSRLPGSNRRTWSSPAGPTLCWPCWERPGNKFVSNHICLMPYFMRDLTWQLKSSSKGYVNVWLIKVWSPNTPIPPLQVAKMCQGSPPPQKGPCGMVYAERRTPVKTKKVY